MTNKSKIITIIVAVVLVLVAIVYVYRDSLFGKVNVQSATTNSQVNTTSATYKQYAEMKGETYDRNFIAGMIAHHEGAVDMAKQAQTSAKHQELKDLADNIVSTQQKEIADMTSWQKKWNYPSTSADNMMDHSAMGMMDEMTGMTAELKGKTGDDFDKAFIEQMIMHHQSAIDMAAPAETNAEHQEVKDLARAIIVAQTEEISQMEQWQNSWGYNQ